MADIFLKYFSYKWNFTVKSDFKNKCIYQLDSFANKVIYFWKKLPNQILKKQ